jgi:hypothetical protein
MCESREVRRLFGLKRQELREEWKKWIMRSVLM